MRRLKLVLVISATWSLTAQGAIATPEAAYGLGAGRTLCAQRASVPAAGAAGRGYVIKNDNYGGQLECLSDLDSSPRFRVSKSLAASFGIEPQSFPEIYVGCSWGRCSRGSPLPKRVSALRDPETGWDTSERADGIWNASYDLWFDRRPIITGQATGAEVMIWLNSQGTESAAGWPVVRLDGTRWSLLTWMTQWQHTRWRYISFRRVDRAWHVSRLRLRPFISLAERRGWISERWYLLNIEAGFEIWRGGTGLATRGFWAHP
jgi:Glycosyl hydrolase family 12